VNERSPFDKSEPTKREESREIGSVTRSRTMLIGRRCARNVSFTSLRVSARATPERIARATDASLFAIISSAVYRAACHSRHVRLYRSVTTDGRTSDRDLASGGHG